MRFYLRLSRDPKTVAFDMASVAIAPDVAADMALLDWISAVLSKNLRFMQTKQPSFARRLLFVVTANTSTDFNLYVVTYTFVIWCTLTYAC